MIGIVLLALTSAAALFAPLLFTVDPTSIIGIGRFKPPSAQAWFGTDQIGRDLYSRVIYGARVSLTVGIAVALLASFFGILLGVAAGFVRWLDPVVMRVMDGLMAIPPILLAIALIALTRSSIQNVIIAIAIAEVPRVARLVRSVALSLREQAFIDAAISNGATVPVIVYRHILPNSLAPIVVQATYIAASAMIAEAVLSFIGAGTPSVIPSWGNIIADGRSAFQLRPGLIFIPAAFLSLTVLAVNMIGDGFRDALDPRFARKF
ncbi:ABC transporter permease [Variovorax sp. LT1R20]|uniref:ABC transporter permease n=1 Tax=Variovorax sp. LT1R20 TaxID=3443729 RepID=UPI003F449AC4